jgi:hypothetical protein
MNHIPLSSRSWFILILCLLIGAIVVFLLQKYRVRDTVYDSFEDVHPAISALMNDSTITSMIKMIQQNPERVHQMIKEVTSTISTMDPKTISSMDVEPLMKLFQNLTPPS